MVAHTFLVRPPALLLTYLEKKIVWQERTLTTSMQGNLRLSEYYTDKLKSDDFHMFSLLLHQCQRSNTQQKADGNDTFHALDIKCRFTHSLPTADGKTSADEVLRFPH